MFNVELCHQLLVELIVELSVVITRGNPILINTYYVFC